MLEESNQSILSSLKIFKTKIDIETKLNKIHLSKPLKVLKIVLNKGKFCNLENLTVKNERFTNLNFLGFETV